jgi:hypothetical protein
MSISTLVIALTLLVVCYALLWHNQTAEGIRHTDDSLSDSTQKADEALPCRNAS